MLFLEVNIFYFCLRMLIFIIFFYVEIVFVLYYVFSDFKGSLEGVLEDELLCFILIIVFLIVV